MDSYYLCCLETSDGSQEVHWVPANYARSGKIFRVRRLGGWHILKVLAVGKASTEGEILARGGSRISSKFISDV